MQENETWAVSLGWGDSLEEGMAAHASILSWRIPWTEEPGGLQSIGSHRVRHNKRLSMHTCHLFIFFTVFQIFKILNMWTMVSFRLFFCILNFEIKKPPVYYISGYFLYIIHRFLLQARCSEAFLSVLVPCCMGSTV